MRPKPVKAFGLSSMARCGNNSFSSSSNSNNNSNDLERGNIRGCWSGANLSKLRNMQVAQCNSRFGKREGQLDDVSTILRSNSAAPVMAKGTTKDDHLSNPLGSVRRASAFGLGSRKHLLRETSKWDSDENISRTPSPVLGRVDLEGDIVNLRPERSNSPNFLYFDDTLEDLDVVEAEIHNDDNGVIDDDDDQILLPSIMQVGIEIQNILFQQQRSSIGENGIDNMLGSDEFQRDSTSHLLSLNSSFLEDVDREDLPWLDLMDHSFLSMDNLGNSFEEEDQHMTSISTDAIQSYLEEFSLHDNCPSPPMRASNGVAFDDYFQHRNASQLSIGSLDGYRIGAEIGLFNLSPASSASSMGVQQPQVR